MISTLVYGLIAAAVMIAVGVFMFRWMLGKMDDYTGFKDEDYLRLPEDPKAFAIYLAARLIAVALIVSAIVGRFI